MELASAMINHKAPSNAGDQRGGGQERYCGLEGPRVERKEEGERKEGNRRDSAR